MQGHLSARGGQVLTLFIKFLYFRNKWDCLQFLRVVY